LTTSNSNDRHHGDQVFQVFEDVERPHLVEVVVWERPGEDVHDLDDVRFLEGTRSTFAAGGSYLAPDPGWRTVRSRNGKSSGMTVNR
jgi:hypothetical protein